MTVKRLGFLLLLLMISASLAATLIKPRNMLAWLNQKDDFEKLVPRDFGEWAELPSEGVLVVDPVQKAELEYFYSQTLSRTYVNSAGYKIMLSIAYGEIQTDSMRVHSPEVCYPAQGFQILSSTVKKISLTPKKSIPVTYAIAKSQHRIEPMTYFVLVGDKASAPGLERKLVQLEYGFKGLIPDGLLVRVSSIDQEAGRAEKNQSDFLISLFGVLDVHARSRIFGQR